MTARFASVDIGTNSAILLIAERRDGFLQPVYQQVEVPRVGRNLSATGRISEASFHALTEALHSFLAEISRHQARLVGAVATQAFRIAANGPELLAKVSGILGCQARIIAGPEESRLGYLAVADRHAQSPEEAGQAGLAVLDIGGGSTEISRKGGGESIPIGAVVVMEACGQDAASSRARAAAAFSGRFRDWNPQTRLVTVGGTATALAMLELKLSAFDSAAVEGLELDRARVSAAIDLLAGLSLAERAELPGMDKGRADILMAGLCILEAFLDAVGEARFRVSDRGIRYGIIVDWLAASDTEIEPFTSSPDSAP